MKSARDTAAVASRNVHGRRNSRRRARVVSSPLFFSAANGHGIGGFAFAAGYCCVARGSTASNITFGSEKLLLPLPLLLQLQVGVADMSGDGLQRVGLERGVGQHGRKLAHLIGQSVSQGSR